MKRDDKNTNDVVEFTSDESILHKETGGSQNDPKSIDIDPLAMTDVVESSLPQPGDIIAEKYRIEEKMGQGGMGVVFLAIHKVTGKRLVIKWMLPNVVDLENASKRFVREAQAAGRINHPNVVAVFDVGRQGNSLYQVMELLEGEPLSQLLSKGPMNPKEAVALLMPVLRGVAEAHQHGVVHRDLKPENVFLCRAPDGSPLEPKVLDFGVSKIVNADETFPQDLTRSGAALGTPLYMAPEQAFGEQDSDHRADIYSLGVILYEMLTGVRPFDAESPNKLLIKVAMERPKPVSEVKPDVPAALSNVVDKAMASEPEQRFSDIQRFAEALEPFAEGMLFRPMNISNLSESELRLGTEQQHKTSHPYIKASGVKRVVYTAAAVVVIILSVRAFQGMLQKREVAPSEPHLENSIEQSSHSIPTKTAIASKTDGLEPTEHKSKEQDKLVDDKKNRNELQGNQDVLLYIKVKPSFAEVYIDGDYIGKGSFRLERKKDSKTNILVRAPKFKKGEWTQVSIEQIPQEITLSPKSRKNSEDGCTGDICKSPYH